MVSPTHIGLKSFESSRGIFATTLESDSLYAANRWYRFDAHPSTLWTLRRDDKVGSIRFYPDGGSNGGRITLGAGDLKYEVDVDWLTGRVAIVTGAGKGIGGP